MPTVNISSFGSSPQFENAAGAPAVGDKLFFYQAGTNTKLDTYTNSTGTVLNTNPIILNSLGMPPNELWWTVAPYKVVWAPSTDTDPPTSPIRTWDNQTGANQVFLSSLADTVSPLGGAGVVGFLSSLAYAVGSVGEYLKRITVSAAGTITQPRFIGNNTDDSGTPDAVFRATRTLTAVPGGGGHGVRDDTTSSGGVAGTGYAAFDSQQTISAAGFDHTVSFQSRPIVTGNPTHVYGISHSPVFNAGANAVNSYGMFSFNPTGAGTVQNVYGFYIPLQSKGSVSNYSGYIAQQGAPFYCGAPLQVNNLFTVGPAVPYIIGGPTVNGYPYAGYNYDPTTAKYVAADVAVTTRFDTTGWTLLSAAAGAAGAACTLVPHINVAVNTGIVRMHAYGAGTATFSATGVISSVSDARLKTLDGGLADPVAMLKSLAPTYWRWNEKAAERGLFGRELGFIAQNVQQAIGVEAAPEPIGDAPMGYYDRSVLAVAVAALQDALKRIQALEDGLGKLV